MQRIIMNAYQKESQHIDYTQIAHYIKVYIRLLSWSIIIV